MPKLIKPKFIDPLGDPRLSALSVSPPLRFRNVKSRVFPLKASMSALTSFCDAYLNMDIPPEIVHYAPGLPFVYLLVLNYGNMSTASIEAQNVGWVAQHEVLFLVPLQVWREEAGELVFKGFTTISPFIYVDDQFSLNVGREVYGWNKVACSIEAGVPLWMENPRSKLRQLDLGIVDFDKAYAGQAQRRQPLIQIDLDPPPTFTQFPPDLHNPWLPMWSIPNAIANLGSLVGDVTDAALALRIRGNEPHRSVASMLAMGGEAISALKKVLPRIPPLRGAPISGLEAGEPTFGLPDMNLDTITLKQFRNPENQGLACYQALVHAPLGCDRLNGIGMLGDVNYLRGDTSGGYQVSINQLDTQPIIETLGLEVASWSDQDAASGRATLKPVLPFWLDVDLFYGKGEVVCSRAPWGDAGPRGGWVDEREQSGSATTKAPKPGPGAPEPAPPAPAAEITGPKSRARAAAAAAAATSAAKAKAEAAATAEGAAKTVLPPYYNTTLGAATQPIAGPFHFPDVTLQVYPFLADAEKLRDIIDKHLNDPLAKMYPHGQSDAKTCIENGWHFEPIGSYVYMMVTVYGAEMGEEFSSANNIGSFFDREVTFCVPVKWFDNQGNLMSVAMIEPFTYSNSGRGVATDREIVGYNSIRADIASPEDIWMAPNGPVVAREYLKVTTEALPALNVGQKARQCTLIEIDERAPFTDHREQRTRDVADTWGRDLIDELKRKTFMASSAALAGASYWDNPDRGWPAGGEPVNQVDTGKALALELLTHGQPFNRLIYKQYRDSSDTGRACYQALVHATTTLTSIYDLREIETVTHVRFHRQAGHPIVNAFGLKVKATLTSDGDVIDVLQPLRPFWLRVAMREDLATVACYRAADEPWSIVHPWYQKPDPAAFNPADLFKDRDPADVASRRRPYFLRAAPTRVGSWLGRKRPEVSPRPIARIAQQFPDEADIEQWLIEKFDAAACGASLHHTLKSESTQWLRDSLVNELTWIRIQYDAEPAVRKCFPDSIKATRTGTAVLDFLRCPIEPSAVQNIADRFSIDVLVDIVDAIYGAVPEPSLEKFEPPKDGGAVGRLYNSLTRPPRATAKRAARDVTSKADAAAAPVAASSTDRLALLFPDRDFADDDSRQSATFYKNLRDVVLRFEYFMAAATGSDAKTELVWAWDAILDAKITHMQLQLILHNFGRMPASNRRAFLLSIPQNAMLLLEEAANYAVAPTSDAGRKLQATIAQTIAGRFDMATLQSVKDDLSLLNFLADTLQRRFLDWHYASRWRRLSTKSQLPVHDATMAVANLEEVQLVIDGILSCEWENHGATRWENPHVGSKPHEYISNDPAIALDAAIQGLARWTDPVSKIESNFWIAPVAMGDAPSG